jgi:hypothetical protein
MTYTDYVNIVLTTAIALSAGFQAWFARQLWKLQADIENARKETALYVALELLESESSRDPRNIRVRFENASPVGVLLSHLAIAVGAKGKRADPVNLDLRFAIREYGSRDENITAEVLKVARSVEPADAAWQGSERHTAFVDLTPHYLIAGKPLAGFGVRYRLEFRGSSLFEVAILRPDDPGGKW